MYEHDCLPALKVKIFSIFNHVYSKVHLSV